MKLKVPGDVALAGFADNPLSRYLNPSLTAVCQPTFSIGQNATELLIELIEKQKGRRKIYHHQVKTTLDVQESSARKN